MNDEHDETHDTKEIPTPPLQALTPQPPDETPETSVPITEDQWRMFEEFKAATEKRLAALLSADEIRALFDDIARSMVNDRPTSNEVAAMLAAERKQVDFILTSAIESVKSQGEVMAAQNKETAERLAREGDRMRVAMQEAFARSMADLREVALKAADEAKAAVNQHTGSIRFLETIVADFNKRTDVINARVDDYAAKYTQAIEIAGDTEQRLVEFIQPFQGESGFIALVKKQSKVIEAQQRTAEFRQKFFEVAWVVVKKWQFWVGFGGSTGATILAIGKALGLF